MISHRHSVQAWQKHRTRGCVTDTNSALIHIAGVVFIVSLKRLSYAEKKQHVSHCVSCLHILIMNQCMIKSLSAITTSQLVNLVAPILTRYWIQYNVSIR